MTDKPTAEPLSDDTLRPWTWAYRYASPTDGRPIWVCGNGGERNGQRPQEGRALCWLDEAQAIIARYEARIAERDADEYTIRRMGTLLAEIAVIVDGPELPRHRHGYADLPAKVAALEAERNRYHDALIARHGGEPVALLDELDAERAKVAALEAERDDDGAIRRNLLRKLADAEAERDALKHDILQYQKIANDEAALRVKAEKEIDALRADAQGWMLIEEDPPAGVPDAPLDTTVLLAWRDGVNGEWIQESGWAGSERGGWRHGRATHWRPLLNPPTQQVSDAGPGAANGNV